MRSWKEVAGLVMLLGVMGIAHADEKEELLKLKNTTVNLIRHD
jgi:hypothetical protein